MCTYLPCEAGGKYAVVVSAIQLVQMAMLHDYWSQGTFYKMVLFTIGGKEAKPQYPWVGVQYVCGCKMSTLYLYLCPSIEIWGLDGIWMLALACILNQPYFLCPSISHRTWLGDMSEGEG